MQATEKINALVGEKGAIDVNLRDVFSAVLKKHVKDRYSRCSACVCEGRKSI